MQAAIYTKTKSGKVLELKNLEQPLPKDNEVVLRVRAASVNPLDWRMKEKRPGVDVAGEIVAVGQAVTQFKPGDAVFGVAKGAFAEFACASAADRSASALRTASARSTGSSRANTCPALTRAPTSTSRSMMRPPASHDRTMFCASCVCGPAAGPHGVATGRP